MATAKRAFLLFFAILWAFPTSNAAADVYATKTESGSFFFTDAPSTAGFKLIIKEEEPDRPWREIARTEALRRGLDPLLVRALIRIESGDDPTAVSHKGAVGLMQLMPATARELGFSDIKTPQKNIAAGVKYFADLLQQFEGRVDLALAAYNAGPGAVRKHGGIPPFTETINFVDKVIRVYDRLKENMAVDTSHAIMHNHQP